MNVFVYTERPPPLERPPDNINQNISVFISTPGQRPPLSQRPLFFRQEGIHCIHTLTYLSQRGKEKARPADQRPARV